MRILKSYPQARDNTVKIGIVPVNIGITDAEQMVGLAQLAEAHGVESVWTFEHVIVPLDYQSKYPYSPNGKMGVTPETPLVDPLIALTLIAAHTKTLRLGTGVNILSQSNPLYMAKQAASLDMLSRGRLMLGLGIGWLREEFIAMGVPFERRGARFDDYVVAMRKVWSGDVVEHNSAFVNWQGFKSYPLPNQTSQTSHKPTVPVIVGGAKGKIFERIARFGDGWFAPMGSPDELKAALIELAEACKPVGRDPASIEITAMLPPGANIDAVRRLGDAGAHRLTAMPLMAGGNPADAIKQLGDTLIAHL